MWTSLKKPLQTLCCAKNTGHKGHHYGHHGRVSRARTKRPVQREKTQRSSFSVLWSSLKSPNKMSCVACNNTKVIIMGIVDVSQEPTEKGLCSVKNTKVIIMGIVDVSQEPIQKVLCSVEKTQRSSFWVLWSSLKSPCKKSCVA